MPPVSPMIFAMECTLRRPRPCGNAPASTAARRGASLSSSRVVHRRAMWSRAVMSPWVVMASALAPANGSASELVGAARCQSCHSTEHAQWSTTGHARGLDRLPASQRRDPRCVGCHATSATTGLVRVECESCHGAGRAHVEDPRLPMARGADPVACLRCHTVDGPRIVPFALEPGLARVRHAPAASLVDAGVRP